MRSLILTAAAEGQSLRSILRRSCPPCTCVGLRGLPIRRVQRLQVILDLLRLHARVAQLPHQPLLVEELLVLLEVLQASEPALLGPDAVLRLLGLDSLFTQRQRFLYSRISCRTAATRADLWRSSSLRRSSRAPCSTSLGVIAHRLRRLRHGRRLRRGRGRRRRRLRLTSCVELWASGPALHAASGRASAAVVVVVVVGVKSTSGKVGGSSSGMGGGRVAFFARGFAFVLGFGLRASGFRWSGSVPACLGSGSGSCRRFWTGSGVTSGLLHPTLAGRGLDGTVGLGGGIGS